MERLMRYKTLQCFLAALIMIVFLAPAAYASGTPDAYEASANAVSEKYIGKTVPGACVVISEYDNTVFAKGYGFADLENNTAMDPETTVFEWGSISKLGEPYDKYFVTIQKLTKHVYKAAAPAITAIYLFLVSVTPFIPAYPA